MDDDHEETVQSLAARDCEGEPCPVADEAAEDRQHSRVSTVQVEAGAESDNVNRMGEGESISEAQNAGLGQKQQPARRGRKKKLPVIEENVDIKVRRTKRVVTSVDYRENKDSDDEYVEETIVSRKQSKKGWKPSIVGIRYDEEEPKARRRMKNKDENDDGDEEDTIVSRKQNKSGQKPSIGGIRSDEEEPKARRRMKKKDENGNDIQSNMCHQCQRNDKGRVVRCTNCSKKRYCVHCMRTWYPKMSEHDFTVACPICCSICNCKPCLHLDIPNELQNLKAEVSDENRVVYSKYIMQKLILFLQRFNEEQTQEKEIEAAIQGLPSWK